MVRPNFLFAFKIALEVMSLTDPIIVLKYPKLLFLFNRDDENVSENSVLRSCLRKYMQNSKIMDGGDAALGW